MPLGFEVLNCISFITSFTSSSSTLLSTSLMFALSLSNLFTYVLVQQLLRSGVPPEAASLTHLVPQDYQIGQPNSLFLPDQVEQMLQKILFYFVPYVYLFIKLLVLLMQQLLQLKRQLNLLKLCLEQQLKLLQYQYLLKCYLWSLQYLLQEVCILMHQSRQPY